MQTRLLHPTWQELSVPERIQEIDKVALRSLMASPTAAVPSAAPFLGNQTALAFTISHTATLALTVS